MYILNHGVINANLNWKKKKTKEKTKKFKIKRLSYFLLISLDCEKYEKYHTKWILNLKKWIEKIKKIN